MDFDGYVHCIFENVYAGDKIQTYHFYLPPTSAKQFKNLPKGIKRVRVDPENLPHSKEHVHIYKNHEYIVIRKDGTQRHSKGPIKIPRSLYKWIRKNLPDFNLPTDRVIQFHEEINIPTNLETLVIEDHIHE